MENIKLAKRRLELVKTLKTVVDEEEINVQINKSKIEIDQSVIEILKEDKLGTLISIDGEEILVDDIVNLEDEGIYRVEISGYTIDVKVVDPINEALNIGAGEGGDIISPMSGTISSINVSIGDKVSQGDVLLVISAMKMENQIVTPVDGVVRDIKVNNNEQVPSGKLLITVEPGE